MFETADMLLTASKGGIGKAIRWVLKIFQSDPVFFNHCILVANNKFGIEAELNGVKYCNLQEKMTAAKAYKLIRCKSITDAKKESIVTSSRKLVGLRYGYKRLLLQLLDQMFSTNFFTRSLGDNRCQVCSSLIAWAYYVRCRVKFNGVEWKSCEPDDVDDETLLNPDMWEIIAEKGN